METTTLERPDTEPQDEPQPPQEPTAGDEGTVEPAAAENGEELFMEGDEAYPSTDAGGKAPTDSKLQIVGRSISIEGQVRKGARIQALVELEVGAVKFQDKKDSQTDQVVASTRTHYAQIVGFARDES